MKKYIALILSLGFLTSCANMTQSGMGTIYTDVKEPVIAKNGIPSHKTGRACQTSWFGLVALGDASVEAAKKNGDITMVSTIDIEKKFLLVYGSACTVVKGH